MNAAEIAAGAFLITVALVVIPLAFFFGTRKDKDQ